MNLQLNSPKQALNKAYLKEKVGRNDIEKFKANLNLMISRINETESEEHLKNVISDFLKDTWYKEFHEINTKEKNDLVIHTGKTTKDPVGVIIEAKKPSNKIEMISEVKPNAKALHELILYYLRERIEHSNIDIKYLVVTNIYEWYIIDEIWFERNIYRNNKLKKDYENWKLSGKDTKFFYDSIAKPLLDSIEESISCTYFDIRHYEKAIENNRTNDDNKLIALYKILSPSHLLKQPFRNDSNSLDRKFYSELLHIIGLEEIEEGKKKLINRKKLPDEASLIENIVTKLKSRDSLRNIENLTTFGNTKEEQIYNIALELCITWINRVLFLKLLEAQLFNYHKGNKEYLFLNSNKIYDFDELSNLFFQVLAERGDNRTNELKVKFDKVPYLNSSLFERTHLERHAIDIGNLDNRLQLPLFHSTVLKNELGKRKSGSLTLLQYLFQFLDAYDFTSEGSVEIQEENKNLISASVLGLIFEKINGYKEGSFFTPGFVTMHMCKEAIRKSVLEKFNRAYKIDCETFEDLKNFITGRFKTKDILEFNALINELKICDPAVGSGHFLVSALNEIIAIKAELGILADKDGLRLTGYEAKIENDEFIITYNDNTEIYQYTVTNSSINKDIQRVQETIFHEKEIIIENCLFGVDINPNSVKICRLRLWIELLKNAYYTKESNFKELETLPNIDINIKCGNSMISRFELVDELKSSFKKINFTFQDYKLAVRDYKITKDREKKGEITTIIEKIKRSFQSSLDEKFIKRISKARGKVTNVESEINRKKEWKEEIPQKLEAKLKKARLELKKVEQQKEDILSNVIYQNSFEWRFEFPEVLNDNEDFVGFDVVIGNPPYIPLEDLNPSQREFFREKYSQFERKYETSVMFIVEGLSILNPSGILAYIAPITWQTGENYPKFRQYLFEQKGIQKIINLPFNVFADAYVDTAIYIFSNSPSVSYKIFSFNKKDSITSLEKIEFHSISKKLITGPKFKIILNPFVYEFLNKLDMQFVNLGEITISTQGLAGSSFKSIGQVDQKKHFPFLEKGNVYNYHLEIEKTFFTSLEDKPSLKIFYEAKPKLLIRRIINRQDRLSVGYTEKRMVFKKDINPFISTTDKFHPKFLLSIMASRLISFIYLNISSIASKDDFRQTTLAELREIPIPALPIDQQQPFVRLAEYILCLSDNKMDYSFFERMIDAIVYEVYLPGPINEAGCQILKYLNDLPQLNGNDDEEDIKIIGKAYKDFSSPNNPISTGLLKLLNVKDINIIEGRKL
jgi:hypothetical protein